mgnify:CR=1 FL=1
MTGSKLKQWFVEWWLLLVPATFALGAVTTYAIVFRSLPATENPAAWGTFGDFVGGLMNPLVSVLTLFVAISVWRLQKAELELTRSEMAQTKEAMEDQAKTAEQQRREQRFFDLLNLYHETLKTFVIEGSAGKAALNSWQKLSSSAHDCEDFLHRGWDEFDFHYNARDPHSNRLIRASQKKTYTESQIAQAWSNLSPQFDHYFRTIFAILNELERLLNADHWRYGKLFRAQLSRDELTLLAFNVLFDSEGKKMRPLVCKYGLLKHLANTKLRDHAIKELAPTAFGLSWTNTKQSTAVQESPNAP